MKQSPLLRLFLCLLCLFCNLSLQSQLFRDLSGLTIQNLEAQASQWTLSDSSGTQYPLTVSQCQYYNIVGKSSSTGSTLKKTFDNLENHNILRFFVKMYYMGEYSSQTVDIKFDDISLETSEVLSTVEDPEDDLCFSLPYAGRISYFGTVEHNSSSVTVEFSSNLHGTNVEIAWGLRDFSFVPDFSDTSEPSIIYAYGYDTDITILPDECGEARYLNDKGDCPYCNEPCSICYGSGSDKCFAYLSSFPEARLCPQGQTLLSSGCSNCPENCPTCDQDVNKCDTCLTTCALCQNNQCQECTLESNFVLYQGSCLASCPAGYYANFERKCQLCLSTGCPVCSGNMVAQDGICKCRSPRILIGNNCECPAYMVESSDASECEYIDLINIAYQSTVSPLFDAILQVHMNPLKKWTAPVLITWAVDCEFKNLNTRNQFQAYMSTQNTDILLIPSSFLEYSFRCNVRASYFNQNSKAVTFTTLSSSQPQVQIAGGPFQRFDHTEVNVIFAEVKSSAGKVLSASDLQQIKWTQTSGDQLNMNSIFTSSKPFQLTIPICILSQGKIYKFKLSVTLKSNKLAASQEVTIAIYAPKLKTQIILPTTENYHLTSKSLTLKAQLSLQNDECNQSTSLSAIIDQSTAMYTWECFYLDLGSISKSTRLLERTSQITDDPNIQLFPDPLGLFYHSTSSPTLTVPASYLTLYPDFQFIFYLTVTVKSKSPTPTITKFNIQQPSLYTLKNQTSLKMVTSKPSIPTPSFTCMSENNCQANHHSDFFPTKFVGSPSNIQYSYNWQVDTFRGIKYIPSVSTFLTIRYITNYQNHKFVPQILFTISDGTNTASTFLTLPWNYAPKNGFINVYPSTGKAYTTRFFISTYNWTDLDLPVSFQFFSKYNTYVVDKNFMPETLNPYDETILLSEYYQTNCFVGVIVKDNLKAPTEIKTLVELTGSADSLCDALEKGKQAFILSKQSQNLYQRFRFIQIIMENLGRWEREDDKSPCNVTDAQFKFTALTEMRDIFVALNKKAELRAPLLNSISFGSDQAFTQENYWDLSMDILDSYFQAASSTAILPSEEYNPLMLIIDNLIYSMKKPTSSIEDPDRVFLYINTLVRSTLYNMIPTDEEIVYKGTFYTYFTIKNTYCQVQEELTTIAYGYSYLDANVTVRKNKQIPPEKCNDQIDMIFMAFRPNYTILSTSKDPELSIFYFDLRDSLSGKSLLDIFTYVLHVPFDLCPPEDNDNENGEEGEGGEGGGDEEGEGEGWICEDCEDDDVRILDDVDEDDEIGSICEDCDYDSDEDEDEECSSGGDGTSEIYGIFDLKNQINKIFLKSNIAQIQNISVLEDFQFWKSVAFWTVIAFSGWFLFSFYWLYVKHPTYCALKANPNIIQKSLFKKSNLFFWVIHPLVGIYLYNDPKATKSMKLAIYYQRLVIVMVFSTIFSSIEKGEGQVFKTYILLFNTVTVTPINALLNRLFDNVFSTKNSKKKLITKLKLFTGILFYLAFLAGCFIIIFIIGAQQETSQNKDWAFNFLISFIQDLTLSPSISIISKVFLIRLSQSDRFSKIINHPKLRDLLLPEAFRSIYQTIFIRIAIKNIVDDCQSPQITTTSPVSSDRKLLKLNSLDFKSPTSSKNHSPVQLRNRRASETDMNTVDIMTTEALVTNRFQTFFSEAKPETVKEFSPIMKENYPKMQSSNLYSSGFSSTKLVQSVGGGPKSFLLKLKKMKAKSITSIEFIPEIEPAEISPEEVFNFEENAETLFISQPKSLRNSQTFEISENEEKTKIRSKSVV